MTVRQELRKAKMSKLMAMCSFFCLVMCSTCFCDDALAQSDSLTTFAPIATSAVGDASLLTPVDVAEEFSVPPGQAKTFTLSSGVEGVNISNRTVCNVEIVGAPGRVRGLVVTGLQLGATQFTVWGDSGIYTFKINVVPDRAVVLAELLSKYPNSQLRLIASPESEKVIVKGTLPSTAAMHDVLEHLVGPDLSRSQIINRLATPCCTCICYPQRRFSSRCH